MKTCSPFRRARTAAGPLLFVPLLGLLALGTFPIAACTAGGSAPETASAAEVPFDVEISDVFVAVLNSSGAPLTDIRVTVVPAGPLRFTSVFSRIEPRARHAFNIADFRAHDNSPLNLRVVRPQAVLVEVMDADGNEHQLQLPWKR